MNTSKLLAILLCFASCVATTTTAFAQDYDFAIEFGIVNPYSPASTYNPYPVSTGYGSQMYGDVYYPEGNVFGGVNPYSPAPTYDPYPVSTGYGSPMYDEYYPEGNVFGEIPKKEDGTLDMEAWDRNMEMYDTYRRCMNTFTQRRLDLAEERSRLNEIYNKDRKLQQETYDREMAFVNRQTMDEYRTANQNGLHQIEPYSDIYDDYHGNYYQIDPNGDIYSLTR